MAPNEKVCNRCERLGRPSKLPLGAFYRDASGKPLPTCKKCRIELAREYYLKYKEGAVRAKEIANELPETGRVKLPELAAARTIVTIDAPAGPKMALWRCMACYAKAVTRAAGSKLPAFPDGWKHMRVPGWPEPVVLCVNCSAVLTRAKRVLDRISERARAQAQREVAS